MIDGVAKSGLGRVELSRAPVEGSAAVNRPDLALERGRAGAIESSIADLASAGPPVDSEKVAAIRAAIAEGRYPVDPELIAERMIALDLPRREA